MDSSRIGARLAQPLPSTGDITARPAHSSNVLPPGGRLVPVVSERAVERQAAI